MQRWWRGAAVASVVALAACVPTGRWTPPPVGSCVRSDEAGVVPVACDRPHTHRVVAIAPRPEACPPGTDLSSTPADPALGTVTSCLRRDP